MRKCRTLWEVDQSVMGNSNLKPVFCYEVEEKLLEYIKFLINNCAITDDTEGSDVKFFEKLNEIKGYISKLKELRED